MDNQFGQFGGGGEVVFNVFQNVARGPCFTPRLELLLLLVRISNCMCVCVSVYESIGDTHHHCSMCVVLFICVPVPSFFGGSKVKNVNS